MRFDEGLPHDQSNQEALKIERDKIVLGVSNKMQHPVSRDDAMAIAKYLETYYTDTVPLPVLADIFDKIAWEIEEHQLWANKTTMTKDEFLERFNTYWTLRIDKAGSMKKD